MLGKCKLQSELRNVFKTFHPRPIKTLTPPTTHAVPSNLPLLPSSLTRLIREEASYHKEQRHQEAAIAKLEEEDKENVKEGEGEEGNRAFTLGQQVCFWCVIC
jgi:hypothetical protein